MCQLTVTLIVYVVHKHFNSNKNISPIANDIIITKQHAHLFSTRLLLQAFHCINSMFADGACTVYTCSPYMYIHVVIHVSYNVSLYVSVYKCPTRDCTYTLHTTLQLLGTLENKISVLILLMGL